MYRVDSLNSERSNVYRVDLLNPERGNVLSLSRLNPNAINVFLRKEEINLPFFFYFDFIYILY